MPFTISDRVSTLARTSGSVGSADDVVYIAALCWCRCVYVRVHFDSCRNGVYCVLVFVVGLLKLQSRSCHSFPKRCSVYYAEEREVKFHVPMLKGALIMRVNTVISNLVKVSFKKIIPKLSLNFDLP